MSYWLGREVDESNDSLDKFDTPLFRHAHVAFSQHVFCGVLRM